MAATKGGSGSGRSLKPTPKTVPSAQQVLRHSTKPVPGKMPPPSAADVLRHTPPAQRSAFKPNVKLKPSQITDRRNQPYSKSKRREE